MEVPGRPEANVVVAVTVPVVDVEAVLVEVADTRDIAERGAGANVCCLSPSISPRIESYCSCEPMHSFP